MYKTYIRSLQYLGPTIQFEPLFAKVNGRQTVIVTLRGRKVLATRDWTFSRDYHTKPQTCK